MTSIFLWSEGPYDDRFISSVIKPLFASKYNTVSVINYARMKNNSVRNYLKAIKQNNDNFLFFADLDDVACVTRKKDDIKQNYGPMADERIIVVVPEIESWYIAGLNSQSRKNMNIRHTGPTDSLDKEKFNILLKKSKYTSKNDFTIEILKRYKLEEARKNNSPLSRFYDRYCSN